MAEIRGFTRDGIIWTTAEAHVLKVWMRPIGGGLPPEIVAVEMSDGSLVYPRDTGTWTAPVTLTNADLGGPDYDQSDVISWCDASDMIWRHPDGTPTGRIG